MIAQIGPYRVEREIGRGGMGVVYLARDPRLERDVAIKALPEELAGDAGRLERFEREARTLAGLNHPNVAGILGVEEQDGARYLVLEYVEGEALDERLDRGALPVDEAIDYAVQIAAGLEAAHDAGVVHRDLKPANIKITPDGSAKILDFGLARADEQTSASSFDSPTAATPVAGHSPTIPGAILGTAAYMSPEQARGRRVDRRTDIWAFGVVLYEMLTGGNPFRGETATDSIGAVLHKDVDLSRLPSDTPASVRRVIERCLVRDRASRWRDAGDLRVELRAIERVSASGAEAPSRGRATWLVVSLVALVVVGVLALTRSGGGTREFRETHLSVLAPEGVRVVLYSLSPDGRRVAIAGDSASRDVENSTFVDSVWVRDLGEREWRLVPESAGSWYMRFSPDSRSIYFLTQGEMAGSRPRLMRAPADLSGPTTKVLDLPSEFGVPGRRWFCWSPDGLLVTFDADKRELVFLDAGTGREERRAPLVGLPSGADLAGMAGSFGERWISAHALRFTDDGYREDVLLIDVETGVAKVLLEGANHARLLDNGRVLFVRKSVLMSAGFDAEAVELVGPFDPALDELGTRAHWDHSWFEVSETGTLVYESGGVRGADRSIVLIDPDDTERLWSDERRGYEEAIAISNDGRRVAVIISGPGGLFEIWVSEEDRKRFRRLLSKPGADYYAPRFTPDGEYLVLSARLRDTENTLNVLVARFDGTEPERHLYSSTAIGMRVHDVSPDGRYAIVSEHFANGSQRLLEISLDGSGEPRALVEDRSAFYSAGYAPEGLPLISYVTDSAGSPQAVVREYRDGRLGPEIPVTAGGVWTCGWYVRESDSGETETLIWHLGLDRKLSETGVTYNGRITLGETTTHERTVQRLEAGYRGQDGLLIGIRPGADEGPVTHLEVVRDWGWAR